MRKIVVVHGVGKNFQKDTDLAKFCAAIQKGTGAETSLFQWNHAGEPLPDPRPDCLIFGGIRSWAQEVMMDAAYAADQLVSHGTSILPPADMYIGHSAGGILVSAIKTGPRCLLGCPVQLLRSAAAPVIQEARSILNVMHSFDLIAAPVAGAVDMVVKEPFSLYKYGPQGYIYSHCSYWKDREVIALCTDWFKDAYPEG